MAFWAVLELELTNDAIDSLQAEGLRRPLEHSASRF
jgi:hypothetical protein